MSIRPREHPAVSARVKTVQSLQTDIAMLALASQEWDRLTNKKRSAGIGAYYARGTGVEVYARAWADGPFRALVRRPASDFERRNALLTAAVPQWGTCNAFVFRPDLLDARVEALLLARFKGEDALSHVVDAALQAGVAAAPR